MNTRSDRMKMIDEGDRISSLPDDLAARILSFIGTKQAVQTSALSSRWRFIWTKLPYLNFSSRDFRTLTKFHKFLTHVLSSCSNQVEMSVNLNGDINQPLVQKILSQVCSQNLKQLTFTYLPKTRDEFPLSLFSSRSLKHLTLVVNEYLGYGEITPTSMWKLPNLTTLHLEGIAFCDNSTKECVGMLSEITNLKYLTIKACRISGSNGFTICHTQLSNLTLEHSRHENIVNVVNVVAPQLKNLTVIDWDGELQISACDLTSILYKNKTCKLSLDVDRLPSLEKVGLRISYQYKPYKVDDARKVVDLLQKLSHVKFLTLSLEIIELLSSFIEAIAHQPSPFVNLRSLKIHPELYDEPKKRKVTMSSEINNYLLDTSPGATFTMVTRQESRAVRDTKSAQSLMAELRVLLDVEKAQIEKKEGDKKPQPCTEMPLTMRERETQVCHYWENLNEEIKQGQKKTSDILSLVRRIKYLLMELPSFNKAELQPHLSSLCTEADYIISKILNHVRTGFETKESSLSVSIRQLFAAAQSSS